MARPANYKNPFQELLEELVTFEKSNIQINPDQVIKLLEKHLMGKRVFCPPMSKAQRAKREIHKLFRQKMHRTEILHIVRERFGYSQPWTSQLIQRVEDENYQTVIKINEQKLRAMGYTS